MIVKDDLLAKRINTKGAQCDSSSIEGNQDNRKCHNALDLNYDSDWATQSEGIGAWISVTMPRPIFLMSIRLMQRGCLCEQNKKVRLLIFRQR